MNTTLNKLREHGPCAEGWRDLLGYLGKTAPDDEPLNIATIAKSNGLSHALWALRAVGGHNQELRLFAVWCIRQVQHLRKDSRSLTALEAAEFANSAATEFELSDAAIDAAWAAAAWPTAWDAAWDAARAVQLKRLLEICGETQ